MTFFGSVPRLNHGCPQARGLVAWWPLASYMLAEHIGSVQAALNGSFGLPYPAVHGERGGWVFDASDNQYLLVSSALGIADYPVSFSCWFRPNPATNYDSLIWFGDSSGTGRYVSLEVTNDTLKTLNLEVKTGASLNVGSSNSYTNYEWHHAVGVLVGDAERYLYLDGVQVSDTTNKPITISDYDSFAIGMARDASPRGPYDGVIADVRMYNKALSANDIALMIDPVTRNDLYRWPSIVDFLFLQSVLRVPRYGYVNFQTPGVV